MTKRYNTEFKLNAIRYYEENKKLGVKGCAKDLGIVASTLGKWKREYPGISDIQNPNPDSVDLEQSKEIERLKQELHQIKQELNQTKQERDHAKQETVHANHNLSILKETIKIMSD